MLGVLEMAGRGSGFLRRREAGYLPSNGDVHVGERIIRQYGLRTGDDVVRHRENLRGLLIKKEVIIPEMRA